MSKLIGITGTIGSGKSTVGSILEQEGVPVIDTDLIVHQLLTEDTPVRRAVVERFGTEVLQDNGSGAIDRSKLGRVVFDDARARKDLESLVHPAVIVEFRRRAREVDDSTVVAVLVPLLFEAGLAGEFDEVWTVVASEDSIRQRLKKRDKLSDEQIESRLRAHWPQEKKAASSHRTIDNSGSAEETRRQVELLLRLATDP